MPRPHWPPAHAGAGQPAAPPAPALPAARQGPQPPHSHRGDSHDPAQVAAAPLHPGEQPLAQPPRNVLEVQRHPQTQVSSAASGLAQNRPPREPGTLAGPGGLQPWGVNPVNTPPSPPKPKTGPLPERRGRLRERANRTLVQRRKDRGALGRSDITTYERKSRADVRQVCRFL